MLQEIMEHIHNYFVKEPEQGTFTISGGMLTPAPDLKPGQRFLITGSDLNDGVYTWRANGIYDDDNQNEAGLQDESFTGTVCALAVPPTLIALSGEIRQWVENYGDAMNSPFASENFNGYSYSLKTGNTAQGDGGQLGWQTIYGKRLERWRKPCL